MRKYSGDALRAPSVFGEGHRFFNHAEIGRIVGKGDLAMDRGKGDSAGDNQGRGFR